MSCILRVKVQPGASRDGIAGIHGDAVKIRLRAVAVDGKANAALIEFLAGHFDIPRNSIEIKSGQSSRLKTLRIDLPESKLAERLPMPPR